MVFSNKYFFRCVCLGLLVSFLDVPQDVAADGVMNIVMEDQFQTTCETSVFLGDVVILVYAERSLERMFGIIPGEPNIVVLDTAGQVHSVFSGKLDDQEFQQFVTRVDQIRSASLNNVRIVTGTNEKVLR